MRLTKITHNFIHDGQRFYEGEVRMLDDDSIKYFQNCGWCEGAAQTPPADVTLVVQNGKHGHSSISQ